MNKLITANGCFNITGRGTVIVGEYNPDFPKIKIGSLVVLVQPDGTEITAEVGGTEVFQTISGNKKTGF